MKVIIAPDSFKESLDSTRAAQAIAAGWRSVRPHDELVEVPVADGGEGTAAAFKEAVGGTWIRDEAVGPMGEEMDVFWLLLPDGETAVIDVAAASGLDKLRPMLRNPLYTTTYGTGQLILSALDEGCTRIVIGLGGSATVDGGAGLFQALGGSLQDATGEELAFGGAALADLALIDATELDPRLQSVDLVAACDVTNPLLGPAGAARIFGPQKGADAAGVEELEVSLKHYAAVLREQLDVDVAELPGAGAAGGLGAGLLAFCDAELVPGAALVLEAASFREKIADADLMITGEGRLDSQSQAGKILSALSEAAAEAAVPVVVLVGSVDPAFSSESLERMGVEAIFPIGNEPQSLESSLQHTAQDLERTAAMLARVVALQLGG